MNKNSWIVAIIIVIIGAGGFYAGMQYQAGKAPTGQFAGAAGTRAGFAGRVGSPSGTGGATFGTILSVSPTSITVQLPASTSTSATTGTKLVLYDASTQIQETQAVPTSSLVVGESVTVAGTANPDGSVSATSIQIRPSSAQRPAGGQ